ncbi:serine/threonine-protein kinase [Tamaricihabitans halophyticus]|uniref:serine/threonine-protein kinase n=1 Tax=Tamaricihabitans halophyticus TaxID=1262583 RepID=UPI001FB4FF51|nr:serine/threonine-protein kinase [Tamaricihabitans halophyticus]
MPSTQPEPERLIAGRYRLHTLVGSGSMGSVWTGYDEVLHRQVAVKEVRLPADFPPARADEMRERALREARAIAALSHPNVIAVYDVAMAGAEPFVVMELLPSRSLAALLRTHGALTVPQTAAVGEAVAAALEAAHHSGITHRDVKPGNVLIAEAATNYSQAPIKLTDFGIARNMAEVSMTASGVMLGSPAYIAPEVAAGDPVSPAADLWGLGATLFAAAEGRAPYGTDDDPLQTVLSVVHGEVPTPSPGPFAAIIRGLMVKAPDERMSLLEVRRTLHSLLPEPGVEVFGPAMFSAEPSAPRAGFDPSATQLLDRSLLATPVHAQSTSPELVPAKPPTDEASELAKSELAKSELAGAELSNDPGPLPFAPPSRRRRAGVLARIAVSLAAVLLFLAASAGGFAAVRAVAGKPILPADQPEVGELQPRTDSASAFVGERAGKFRVLVPDDWQLFRTQLGDASLPSGSRAQYLGQDGQQTLTVDFFPEFYPGGAVEDYVEWLRQSWPGEDLWVVSDRRATDRESGAEPARELRYRTVDRGNSADDGVQRRTTFALAFAADRALWVVSVTAPTDDADSARTELYNRIASSFTVRD